MKAFLLGLLGLLGFSISASAGIVVLSGGLTTTAQTQNGPIFNSPLGSESFTRVTEKNYLILDTTSGAYHLLRLFKDNGAKKVAVALTGTVFGQFLPGDSKGKTRAYVYNEIAYTNNAFPTAPSGVTSTILRMSGIANTAAGAAIKLGSPFPSSLTFTRHITHEFYFFMIVSIGDERSQSEQSGKLTLDRPLSKAANEAGNDLATAELSVLAAIHKQGFLGP